MKMSVKPDIKLGVDDDESYNTEHVLLKVWAKVGFFNDRYPHFDENVCDPDADPVRHTSCPFEENEEKIVVYDDLEVPLNFPSTHGIIKAYLVDESTDEIGMCGRMRMRYRKAGDQPADDDEE